LEVKKQRESAPADASEREDLRLILLKLYLVNFGKKRRAMAIGRNIIFLLI
jgi:hypothetical protein